MTLGELLTTIEAVFETIDSQQTNKLINIIIRIIIIRESGRIKTVPLDRMHGSNIS